MPEVATSVIGVINRPIGATASRRGRAPAAGSAYSRIAIVLGSMLASLFVPNSQKNGTPVGRTTMPYGTACGVGTDFSSILPVAGSSRPMKFVCSFVNHRMPLWSRGHRARAADIAATAAATDGRIIRAHYDTQEHLMMLLLYTLQNAKFEILFRLLEDRNVIEHDDLLACRA